MKDLEEKKAVDLGHVEYGVWSTVRREHLLVSMLYTGLKLKRELGAEKTDVTVISPLFGIKHP